MTYITTAFIAVVALATGFMGAHIMKEESAPDTQPMRGQMKDTEAVRASDYLSMRPAITSLPTETLSEAERDGLMLMREEEKLARDVYQTLFDTWELRIFENIAQSEQTHTEAVRSLLEKYDLPDPVSNDAVGVFTNPELQKLYNDLTEQGMASEIDALTVGAIIEDLDIHDLETLLTDTDNADITMVYNNLLRGSQNHLRAFTRQLTMRDTTYEPTYISADAYTEIIESPQERGSGGGNGGQGRGWGNGNGNQGGGNSGRGGGQH